MTSPDPESPPSGADLHHMNTALTLARRGLGRVWPNPSVGCVIVDDGVVVGRGWTQPGGRPHGEIVALERAGHRAQGATAYVSLEPCNHWGKTPSCTEALIKAGIARAVIACEDPDDRVDGTGIARLGAAGISVSVGLCENAARDINAGFFLRVRHRRPLVTLKLATTLDGQIAAANGHSKWITGEVARAYGHGLRASHDVIMIGSGTALADDPELTCRLPGLAEASPVRVVLDSRLRLEPSSRLLKTIDRAALWVLTTTDADPVRKLALERAGARIMSVASSANGRIVLDDALSVLAREGVTRVLVEGGSALAGSLIAADLVDAVEWLRSSTVLGSDALPAIAPLGIGRADEAPRFTRVATCMLGQDTLDRLVRLHATL